jgi:cyclase
MRKILGIGFEKVVLNTKAVEDPNFVRTAAQEFGSQSIVVSIDVLKSWRGKYEVCTNSGRKKTGLDPLEFARTMQDMGAGEILLCSIERDGRMAGYDINLLKRVCSCVTIPVVACGGAGSLQDLAFAVNQGGATAVGVGSMFVFHGPKKGVLVNVPEPEVLEGTFCQSELEVEDHKMEGT